MLWCLLTFIMTISTSRSCSYHSSSDIFLIATFCPLSFITAQ
jgi:hypothetical protein